ncbi:MAG: class I SAM-dependent RNA methyltransferase, partial [Lentisphaeria bacterium]|nr:class I SAM-dependent RNA methyltransferase [Lentisphaeria bacterium]
APGERVEIEVKDDRANFAYGTLLSVKKACSNRITPECPLAINGNDNTKCCPGCSYGHVDYETEFAWKQRQLEGFLLRGGLTSRNRFRPPVAAPQRYGWRNKIRLTAADGKLGYKGDDNTTVLDVECCPLARKSINDALTAYRAGEPVSGASHLTFRWTLKDGVKIRPNTEPASDRFLCEQLGKYGDFFVPENSFFQINVPMAVKLASAAAQRINAGGAENLLELFCGVGVLSITAAQVNRRLQVRGIELDKLAIKAARLNAAKHELKDRCRYEDGDAEQNFQFLARTMPPEKTMILVDPPRCGMSAGLCRKILSYGPKSILYISCAPDTLRRDLEILTRDGKYEVCDVQLFDLFPTTAHFETMTVLRRKA